jgi:hypothetical protein
MWLFAYVVTYLIMLYIHCGRQYKLITKEIRNYETTKKDLNRYDRSVANHCHL